MNHDLDIVIARTLGWRDIHVIERSGFDPDYDTEDQPPIKEWWGTQPDGQQTILYGWSGVISTALTLPLQEGQCFEITVYPDGSAGVDLLSEAPAERGRKHAGNTIADLATAICEVWLNAR